MPPQMPQQPYAPRKKTSAVVWVLLILGGLFLLVILAVGGGVFYLKHRLNAAGVDTELMKRNPTLAAARIAAALNPNIEVLQVNEGRGILTVREKKTGKVYSVNFEDAKNGRWTMTEDGKKTEVSTNGGGPNGTIEMKGPDGTVTIGGSATNIPSWVPQYPGSKPENAVSSNQSNEVGGMYHFKTKDSAEQVIKFYGDEVKSAGLKITNTTTSSGLGDVSAILTAQDDDKNRTVNIAVTTEEGQNGVTVTYASKK